MKLEKKTREKLYKAKGRTVEIVWPVDAPEHPRNGRRYPVYNEDGVKVFMIRLEGTKTAKDVTKATVRIDDDPFRPMFGISGTRNEWGDYVSEPERVHADYENLLAAEGVHKTIVMGAVNRDLRAAAANLNKKQGKLAKQRLERSERRREAA